VKISKKILSQVERLRNVASRSGAALVFLTKIVGAGCALLLNVVVARTLGVHDAGIFFLSVSIVTIGFALARFGFGYTTYRVVAEASETGRKSEVASITTFAVQVVFSLSILTTLVTCLCSELIAERAFSAPDMVLPLIIMALSIPVYCVGGMYSELLKGLRRPISYSMFESVIIKVASIPSVGYLGFKYGLIGAATGFLIANLLALLFVAVRARAVVREIGASSAFNGKMEMLKSTAYFAVVSYSTVAAQWVSPLLVGYILDPASAAVFFAAYRSVTVLDFVLLSIAAVAAPIFVKAYAEGGFTKLLKVTIAQAARALVVSCALALIMFLSASFIMSLYGEEFEAGAGALRAMLAVQVLATPLGVFGLAVSASKGERSMALIAPAACAVGLVSTALLASSFGIEGAALGAVLSSLVMNALLAARFGMLWLKDRASSVPGKTPEGT
jgi:Membrane protein involved in the export of O-antigen and teichoic acid